MTLMSILLGSGGRGRVTISLTAASNNYDVYTNRGPSYVSGASDITVTVAAPTTIGSSSTGAYAMLVPSAFSPTDTVTIVNNGLIQGAGGAGGAGGSGGSAATNYPGQPGFVGGNALYVNRPTTITNNGTIASGGGGGGGGAGYTTAGGGGPKGPTPSTAYPGGGGGGGAGTVGGSGGTPNGGSGTSASGGGAGSGSGGVGADGGPGGGRGAAGTSAPGPIGPGASSGSGAAAGSYIVGSPFVTWPATGTRLGNVS